MKKIFFILSIMVMAVAANAQWCSGCGECVSTQPPAPMDSVFVLVSDSRAGIAECRGEWESIVEYGLIRREKITLTYSQFTASPIIELVNLGYLVSTTNNIVIHFIAGVKDAVFEGGGITAVALDIGVDGSEELYLANADVFTAEPVVGFIQSNAAPIVLNTSTALIATLDISDGNEDDLTAGTVTLYFYYSILN